MQSFPTWAVIPSDHYKRDHYSCFVDGDYDRAATGLITTFRPSRLLGVLFLCYDFHNFHDFYDFCDFQTNIALSRTGHHKKETKIALF